MGEIICHEEKIFRIGSWKNGPKKMGGRLDEYQQRKMERTTIYETGEAGWGELGMGVGNRWLDSKDKSFIS